MRFLDLRLAAYGPFADVTLDLSRGRDGLHVIYGPNEAGKSSALRAVRAFLFGVPGQTRDNFRHDHKDLRIGARLRSRGGEEVVLWRRKGNKDTLLGENLLPVDDGVLVRLLGGLSEQLFNDAFGLDHDQLLRGGDALLAGEGEVGESLFAAGVGTGSLRRLLEGLDGRADDLFKGKGASKPRLNQLLRTYKDLRQELRDRTVTTRDWHTAEDAFGGARAAAAHLDDEIRGVSRERERLLRMQRCLGRLAERRTLVRSFESLQAAGPLPPLPPDFEEDRRGAQRHRDELRTQRTTAEGEVERLRRAIADLPLPSDLLGRAEEIEALHAELDTHLTAARDRVGLEAKRIQAEADATGALHSLRPGGDLDRDGAPTPTVPERRRVAEVAEALAKAVADLAAAEKTRTRLDKELAEAEQRVAALPVPSDPSALERVVARARKAGDLEAETAKARRRATTARASLEAATRALGLFDGAPEALEVMALPEPATIERFRKEHEAAAAALAVAEGDVRRATEELTKVDRERRSLERREVIPTVDDLLHARERRGEGWALVRRAWLAGDGVEVERLAYDADRALPEAYETAVQAADEVADRLREDADNVATKEQLVTREADLRETLSGAQAACGRAREAMGAFDVAWRAAWLGARISPWLPAEMASWLGRVDHVRAQTREVREVETGAEATRTEAERWTRDVLAALTTLGATAPAAASPTLAETLDHAEEVARGLRTAAASRAEVVAVRGRFARQRQDAAEEARTFAEALGQVRGRWAAALLPLDLPPETSPGEARDVLDVLATIEGKRKEAEGYRRRVDAIDRDERTFAACVVEMLRDVASDLVSRPAEAALPALMTRLQSARQIATKRTTATDETARWDGSREEATRDLAKADAEIERLLAAAGVATEAELPGMEARVRTAKSQQDRIAAIEHDLAQEGRGVGCDTLEAEAASVVPDALPGLVEEATRRHEELLQQRARAGEEVGRLEQALVSLRGGGSAPEVAERLSSVVAEIRRVAGEYARAHVARVILRREIERYRQAHQGPLLEGAAALFARITCGAFRALEPDYDESDRPTLKAVRATGERLGVDGMSDGTREQLYLALRLASLERHIAGAEAVPIVVDDLLLRSDDLRSTAILQILADLSARTQILFFTHQSRHVELAEGLRRPDDVFVHRFPSGGIAR